jgi:tripartite-type tricarboxylate transporter receptor subunit TctC
LRSNRRFSILETGGFTLCREDTVGRHLSAAVLAVISLLFALPAQAQDYPTRTITLVVPYPPGGGVDAMARIIAEKMSAALKQQIVVDNRGGGGGTIGTRAVAKAEPDGYTLLLGHSGTVAINPSLYRNPGYDPRRDFAPIGLLAAMPLALVTHPAFPARSVADLIAIARKDPGKLDIGSSAMGTGSYMCAELFKATVGLDMTVVPYRGTGPFLNDILGGHVRVGFVVIPPAFGNIQAGTLRALAVTSPQRTSVLPDVPTVTESGLPGFETVLHYGLLAPAGTPKPIIDRLNKELRALVALPDVRQRIASEGGDPLTSSPEEYAADIDREETKWAVLIRRLNLKVD